MTASKKVRLSKFTYWLGIQLNIIRHLLGILKWAGNSKNIFISVKPDVTLSLKDADLVDLMTGKLNPQKAFFQGKLKVQGNMGLAMKLQEFQKQAGAAMKAKL